MTLPGRNIISDIIQCRNYLIKHIVCNSRYNSRVYVHISKTYNSLSSELYLLLLINEFYLLKITAPFFTQII